jgi:hypothetical protein
MKVQPLIFVIAIAAVCFCQSTYAQDSNPDHQKLIKASHFLEENPLDKSAKAIRSWAFVWSADTKDVTVIICGVGGPFMDKKVKFGNELMSQYAIAMTAFKLEHPEKANDENAAQLAGVESALKVYEILLKDNPKGKADAVDALIVKRDKGELAAYVANADCGKK